MPGEQMNPPGSQHRTLKNSGMNYSQQGVPLDPSKVWFASPTRLPQSFSPCWRRSATEGWLKIGKSQVKAWT